MSVYGQHYAEASDEDLMRLASQVWSLVPEARQELRMEMERRKLPIGAIDWEAQPPKHVAKSGTGRRILRNLALFIVCSLIWLAVISVLASQVRGLDTKEFGGSMADVFLRASLALAVITGWRPLKRKTLLAIAMLWPIVAIPLFLLISLIH